MFTLEFVTALCVVLTATNHILRPLKDELNTVLRKRFVSFKHQISSVLAGPKNESNKKEVRLGVSYANTLKRELSILLFIIAPSCGPEPPKHTIPSRSSPHHRKAIILFLSDYIDIEENDGPFILKTLVLAAPESTKPSLKRKTFCHNPFSLRFFFFFFAGKKVVATALH